MPAMPVLVLIGRLVLVPMRIPEDMLIAVLVLMSIPDVLDMVALGLIVIPDILLLIVDPPSIKAGLCPYAACSTHMTVLFLMTSR